MIAALAVIITCSVGPPARAAQSQQEQFVRNLAKKSDHGKLIALFNAQYGPEIGSMGSFEQLEAALLSADFAVAPCVGSHELMPVSGPPQQRACLPGETALVYTKTGQQVFLSDGMLIKPALPPVPPAPHALPHLKIPPNVVFGIISCGERTWWGCHDKLVLIRDANGNLVNPNYLN